MPTIKIVARGTTLGGVLVSVVYFLTALGGGASPWFAAIVVGICTVLVMARAPRHDLFSGFREMQKMNNFLGAVLAGVVMFVMASFMESILSGLARGLVVMMFIGTTFYVFKKP
jgi:hypothetical protein